MICMGTIIQVTKSRSQTKYFELNFKSNLWWGCTKNNDQSPEISILYGAVFFTHQLQCS